MSQSVTLQLKGIFTHPNPLSGVPQGSLNDAINININRNDVAEPRRGFYQYSQEFTQNAKQLFTYKDVILAHVDTSLYYDSNSNGAISCV